jgi:hypothetical protein
MTMMSLLRTSWVALMRPVENRMSSRVNVPRDTNVEQVLHEARGHFVLWHEKKLV